MEEASPVDSPRLQATRDVQRKRIGRRRVRKVGRKVLDLGSVSSTRRRRGILGTAIGLHAISVS